MNINILGPVKPSNLPLAFNTSQAIAPTTPNTAPDAPTETVLVVLYTTDPKPARMPLKKYTDT